MKKLLDIALGIVTSVGGFLEIGSLVTAAQAGSEFGYQLLWAVALGGLCVALLVEMSGRFAAMSGSTIVDAIRERFGPRLFAIPFITVGLVSLMVLVAEIGGVCVALELATGIALQWWTVPVALVVLMLLWKGSFKMIENGVSLLGLVTVCFIVAAVTLGPHWNEVARGLVPTAPTHNPLHYWFIAVSIFGASVSPYLMFFYSSGAIEDKWNRTHLAVNRAVAGLGMGFGTTISIAVLIVAALVLLPAGISIDHIRQVALMLQPALGRWGFVLFVASLGIACLGACLEITLELAYLVAQGFGWSWGKDSKPHDNARFTLTYIVAVLVAAVVVAAGVDPLKMTTLSMALTSATLPVSIFPFIVLLNDRDYVEDKPNSFVTNVIVMLITLLAFVVAVVAIPLEIVGS
jgi:Mn2+/Fe2+ NRAMP family transporter